MRRVCTCVCVHKDVSLVLCRFTNCLAYYALSMSAGNLGGNMYVSFALSGLVEIPSITASYILLSRSVSSSHVWCVCV